MSRKGENIYKRKDKRWEARYVKGYKADGSPKYGYCYGKTYHQAKEKVTKAKVAVLPGNNTFCTQHQYFASYCDDWLRLNRNRVKDSTFVKYSSFLEKHIKPRLGGYPVRSVTSLVIEQFSHELLHEKHLSAKTVRDILTVLHSIMKYTYKQLPDPLPMLDIVYPKVSKQEMRVLTRDEQQNLVHFLLRDMDNCKFGVLLALMTGMRIGEICALRWENISLIDRTIKVSATMQRLQNLEQGSSRRTKIVIHEPKSNNSARLIPLTEHTMLICKARKCANPEAYVLTGETDRIIEPRVLQYRLTQYTKACGLEGVHFHTLRHTFATRCVESDFEIKSLSEILGHSSPRITLERYVHSSMELKRSNMDKLPAIGF